MWLFMIFYLYFLTIETVLTVRFDLQVALQNCKVFCKECILVDFFQYALWKETSRPVWKWLHKCLALSCFSTQLLVGPVAYTYFSDPFKIRAGRPQPCWKQKCNRPSESRAQATEEFETGSWHDAGLKACLRLHSTVTFGRRSGFRIAKVLALQNFWLNDLLHQGSGYVQRRFQNSDFATLERHF
jgi:hypothetical protein